MSNTAIEGTLARVHEATSAHLAAVEAEAARIASLDMATQGSQQRLEALRVQETELASANAAEAQKLAAARELLAKAQIEATNIINAANQRANAITAEATTKADAIVKDAQAGALDEIQQAEKQAYAIEQNSVAAKADLDKLHAQISDAQSKLADIKRAARAFAGD